MLLPLLVVFSGLAVSSSHPDSLSRTQIDVDGARASVHIRFQALSLIEVRPELDRNGDTWLEAQELTLARAEIEGYLLASLRLFQVEGEGDGAPESALTGRLESLEPEDPATLGAFELQNVEARLVFEAARPLAELVVESRLFHETNPWHKDTCYLAWNDEAEVPHLFEGTDARWHFEPGAVRRPGVFALFVRLGVDHIRTGFDHQAFLLALLVASRRVRTLIAVVTAFTLAHSVTLAMAALGWVDVPGRFVELAIALSIAYVACDNLLRREARNPWLEAFLFGLLHGLGFAGFLGESLENEPLKLTALVGFNVGVELGQLVLVFICVLLLALVFREHRQRAAEDPGAGIVPRGVRIVVSVGVALAGFYWFFERAGWLPWA